LRASACSAAVWRRTQWPEATYGWPAVDLTSRDRAFGGGADGGWTRSVMPLNAMSWLASSSARTARKNHFSRYSAWFPRQAPCYRVAQTCWLGPTPRAAYGIARTFQTPRVHRHDGGWMWTLPAVCREGRRPFALLQDTASIRRWLAWPAWRPARRHQYTQQRLLK
jgi:hypothetical protein